MKIKIGLDIHGVIDENPSFFVGIANNIREQYLGEIHIITGSRNTEELRKQLFYDFGKGGVWWNKIHSITDNLEERYDTTLLKKYKNGNPVFPEDIWNSEKGKICDELGIDFHIDDTKEYESYFLGTEFYLWDKDKKNVKNKISNLIESFSE